ncbi:LacI family DNA-binding transcriptional regulator [Streptomyces turgidiscabies]|uniref:LacI family DNA-binding transcriptional regulator n=3 Tax=Streptomyces TaxID=1883 RepID=UPI00076ED200|nr:LacI family DNA-binding transcriptional regulator [Streptomyces turgidiscabies]MDX3494824.1 LacI family DNA-binding transcriptional regulator [Streptomyces turgidiscabies]GAQ71433.1 catabolite control protein A [Streptomyces turgidiscabies]
MTIAYIAETAGVSVPTVSKVLNGRTGVSDETRARIEELIHRYGYRKPPKNRSNLVELVFRELENMWAVEIIRGVERAARRNKVGVLVSEFGLQDNPTRTIDDTLGRRPQCVLSVAQLSEPEREQLKAKGIPFVVFDPNEELPDGVPFVGATNWRGGQAATRHLIGLGHRRIAMITGPDHPFCLARHAGYSSALGEAGLPVDPDLVVKTLLTREDGCTAAHDLLSRPDRPTAVFTANDMQALGVYQAARKLGLRIPDDLSVVGFDDVPAVAWADPPLTTVHQPLLEMAVAATELALALGRGEDVPQVGLEIATTLTVRESTAPPKS